MLIAALQPASNPAGGQKLLPEQAGFSLPKPEPPAGGLPMPDSEQPAGGLPE